ncbi:hypothetical protein BJY52DRAFT_1422310 [Lactarius psammicola]|nr:hypothetical protein BJY52DRAFT_1422310 [Lactarius psammicola]
MRELLLERALLALVRLWMNGESGGSEAVRYMFIGSRCVGLYGSVYFLPKGDVPRKASSSPMWVKDVEPPCISLKAGVGNQRRFMYNSTVSNLWYLRIFAVGAKSVWSVVTNRFDNGAWRVSTRRNDRMDDRSRRTTTQVAPQVTIRTMPSSRTHDVMASHCSGSVCGSIGLKGREMVGDLRAVTSALLSWDELRNRIGELSWPLWIDLGEEEMGGHRMGEIERKSLVLMGPIGSIGLQFHTPSLTSTDARDRPQLEKIHVTEESAHLFNTLENLPSVFRSTTCSQTSPARTTSYMCYKYPAPTSRVGDHAVREGHFFDPALQATRLAVLDAIATALFDPIIFDFDPHFKLEEALAA